VGYNYCTQCPDCVKTQREDHFYYYACGRVRPYSKGVICSVEGKSGRDKVPNWCPKDGGYKQIIFNCDKTIDKIKE